MAGQPVVLLSRRPALFKDASSWRLEDSDLYLQESPSEALSLLAAGDAVVFLFDTEGYSRFRHVIRKFFSLKGDADLVVLGNRDALSGLEENHRAVAVRLLPGDIASEELRIVIDRLLRLRKVRARSGIAGRSRAVSEMISLIAQAAPLDVNILIQGESGTGKELVARAIHEHSSRAAGAFLSLNCGAISEGVLESELFGHARGAFTGAVAAHDGVFRRAHGGTLFLDEVAEMPLGMQTRFLRALETGEFTPVGGKDLQHSDIRLVAATHQDLGRAVERGTFRQDLYFRLRVVVIPTPPLRERREDVPVLAETFIAQENERHGLSVRGIARPALQLLSDHHWPGNIRELRNVISALVVLKQRGMIEADDLPPEVRFPGAPVGRADLPVPLGHGVSETLDPALIATTLLELRQDIKEIKSLLKERGAGPIPVSEQIVETFSGETGYSPVDGTGAGDLQTAERTLIEAALQATGGRRRQAAERLGISERTLYRKIKLYGL